MRDLSARPPAPPRQPTNHKRAQRRTRRHDRAHHAHELVLPKPMHRATHDIIHEVVAGKATRTRGREVACSALVHRSTTTAAHFSATRRNTSPTMSAFREASTVWKPKCVSAGRASAGVEARRASGRSGRPSCASLGMELGPRATLTAPHALAIAIRFDRQQREVPNARTTSAPNTPRTSAPQDPPPPPFFSPASAKSNLEF